MKKLTVLLLVATMSMAMVACGKDAAGTSATQPGNVLDGEDLPQGTEDADVAVSEDAVDTNVEEETPAVEETSAVEDTAEAEDTAVAETPAAEETDSAEENNAAEDNQATYADNFAVDTEAAAAFADKIKAAMAAKDLEALADLTNFPMYAGFTDGGVGVETREAFIELGADRIFTEEMLTSIANADGSNLSPSMAGFSLSESGRPNVIFSVVGGHLAITGMNY